MLVEIAISVQLQLLKVEGVAYLLPARLPALEVVMEAKVVAVVVAIRPAAAVVLVGTLVLVEPGLIRTGILLELLVLVEVAAAELLRVTETASRVVESAFLGRAQTEPEERQEHLPH
jgi:hypothetical protein